MKNENKKKMLKMGFEGLLIGSIIGAIAGFLYFFT